jgi:hypothetical protein
MIDVYRIPETPPPCHVCDGIGWLCCPCSSPGHWARCVACNPDATKPKPAREPGEEAACPI